MTEAEAAAYLGIKQVTLHVARCSHSGRGPLCTVTWLSPRLTVAEYRQEDLDAYRATHPRRNTARGGTRKRRRDRGVKRAPRVKRPAVISCDSATRRLQLQYAAAVLHVEERLAAVRARRVG